MSLLHVSINAHEPKKVATVLSRLMGGEARPFPSCEGCWMAFSGADDGTAIEVFPISQLLTPGSARVEFSEGGRGDPTGTHAAIASPMKLREIVGLAKENGWLARVCDRGSFECVEFWLENRQLVEVLDANMETKYRRDMTLGRWSAMLEDA